MTALAARFIFRAVANTAMQTHDELKRTSMITRVAVAAVLPIACAWVRGEERLILRDGVPLDRFQLQDAQHIGVKRPEQVRVLLVPAVPPHLHPALHVLGEKLGLASRATAGMSLGYGIFIREDRAQSRALLVHELAHTAQYERLGGIRPFLAQYLHECFTLGYPFGPLETEAAQVAREFCG